MIDLDRYLIAKREMAEQFLDAAKDASDREESCRWAGVLEVLNEMETIKKAESVEKSLEDYI